MTPATTAITARVMPLSRSDGAKPNLGGMKKKSKLVAISAAVSSEVPIPNRVEMITTASRLIMTSSDSRR
jgi:hypothetical protein